MSGAHLDHRHKKQNSMYKVVFNEGLGFTQYIVHCDTLKEACAVALKCDNSKIYKDGKRLI